MANNKLKTFVVIHTNCDCCSDTIYRYPTRYVFGPRCPGCGKILGCMQWSIIDRVKALSHFDAGRVFRAKRRKNKKERM